MNMYAHCKKLYKQPNAKTMPCYGSLTYKLSLFSIENICSGIEKLATHKARHLQGIKPKIIKWTRETSNHWMCDMFNLALRHGMPQDWSSNWVKPLHKGGDVMNVNNYWTIMIGSLMVKLLECTMEIKLSGRVEENSEHAKGQANFH